MPVLVLVLVLVPVLVPVPVRQHATPAVPHAQRLPDVPEHPAAAFRPEGFRRA